MRGLIDIRFSHLSTPFGEHDANVSGIFLRVKQKIKPPRGINPERPERSKGQRCTTRWPGWSLSCQGGGVKSLLNEPLDEHFDDGPHGEGICGRAAAGDSGYGGELGNLPGQFGEGSGRLFDGRADASRDGLGLGGRYLLIAGYG